MTARRIGQHARLHVDATDTFGASVDSGQYRLRESWLIATRARAFLPSLTPMLKGAGLFLWGPSSGAAYTGRTSMEGAR